MPAIVAQVAQAFAKSAGQRLDASARMAIAQRFIAENSGDSAGIKTIISHIAVDSRVSAKGMIHVTGVQTQLWPGSAKMRNMALESWINPAGGSETKQVDGAVGRFLKRFMRV